MADLGAGITLASPLNDVTGNVHDDDPRSTGTTVKPGVITFDDSGSSTGFTIASASAVEPGLATSFDPSSGVILTSTGPITETGIVSSTALVINSAGGFTLTGQNVVQSIELTNTVSGDISFTDAATVQLAGVTNSVGNIALTTTSGGDMDLVAGHNDRREPDRHGDARLSGRGERRRCVAARDDQRRLAVGHRGQLSSICPARTRSIPWRQTSPGYRRSLDFSNAQSLLVGSVGGLPGVTTNNGNILLRVSGGDLDIEQPVSTNGTNGRTLAAGLTGQIGLQASGFIAQDLSGGNGWLAGAAVEAIAGTAIDLDPTLSPFYSGLGNRIGATDVGRAAQTAGSFSGQGDDSGRRCYRSATAKRR